MYPQNKDTPNGKNRPVEEEELALKQHLGHKRMESTDGQPSRAPPPSTTYSLPPGRYSPEDILFCVDIGPESLVEMKITGPNGRPTRLEAIKQAIVLFVHSKLTINPDHRFAFAALSKSAHWVLS